MAERVVKQIYPRSKVPSLPKEIREKRVAGYARVSTVSEDEYRRRGDLTDRFRAEEEKLKRLTAERKKRDAESVAIGGMLSRLTELEALPIEFDEKLWNAVVDYVTVYNDGRLVFTFTNGSEETVMM